MKPKKPTLLGSVVSVQPMTAKPKGCKFHFKYYDKLSDEEKAEWDREKQVTDAAYAAVEKDREENGTRYDQIVEIVCPTCGGVLKYSVSSWNGHRALSCKGCQLDLME